MNTKSGSLKYNIDSQKPITIYNNIPTDKALSIVIFLKYKDDKVIISDNNWKVIECKKASKEKKKEDKKEYENEDKKEKEVKNNLKQDKEDDNEINGGRFRLNGGFRRIGGFRGFRGFRGNRRIIRGYRRFIRGRRPY